MNIQIRLVTTTGLFFIASYIAAWTGPSVNRITQFLSSDGSTSPMWMWIWQIVTGQQMDGYIKLLLVIWMISLSKTNAERATRRTVAYKGSPDNNSNDDYVKFDESY